MAGQIVVDASVVMKWLVREEHSEQAANLLIDSAGRGIRLLGPELLAFEVANAILWQQRRGLITLEEADNAIANYPARGIHVFACEPLVPKAVAFARTHQLAAVYDAIYVVLAQQLEIEFWTADRRLLKAIGDAVPWVRWIGDWEPEFKVES